MARSKNPRDYASKQMGDASEMPVAAEVTLAGVPALKMPDNWPHYDVIAQPKVGVPQRIYVRSRTFKRGGDTFVDFDSTAQFDWWAIVLLPGAYQLTRRIFLVPKAEAGFKEAAKDMGVKFELTGPPAFSPDDQLAAFQQAVSQKPSGILLAVSTPELFRGPINSAIEQGIPVICMDADSPESKRILYIGTDNFRAGEESGRRMGELLKGKGNVVVVTVPGQFNLAERLRGVEEISGSENHPVR